MKTSVKWILGVIVFFVAIMLLSLAFGWFGVFQTATVGKAQMNAERKVFEQSQSRVQGMIQTLARYHHEWLSKSDDDKIALESVIRSEFASFDEDTYLQNDRNLYDFLHNIKNK